MDALVPFLVVVGVVLAIGLGIGMLVARPLDRWTTRGDDPTEAPDAPEEPGGDDRPDA